MSLYKQLKAAPPHLSFEDNCKEVIFTVISAMCDNKSFIRFKKNVDSEFRVNAYNGRCALSMNNYQLQYETHDLAWAADDQNWSQVTKMLNSGTVKVHSVKSR